MESTWAITGEGWGGMLGSWQSEDGGMETRKMGYIFEEDYSDYL